MVSDDKTKVLWYDNDDDGTTCMCVHSKFYFNSWILINRMQLKFKTEFMDAI